jgi:WD40 repeat protein
VSTGNEAADFELGPYVRCLAFSRDEKTLAAGAGDGTVGFWDVNGWKEKPSWRAGTEPLFSLIFGETAGSLIAASKDGTATIWQLAQPPKGMADTRKVE